MERILDANSFLKELRRLLGVQSLYKVHCLIEYWLIICIHSLDHVVETWNSSKYFLHDIEYTPDVSGTFQKDELVD